MALGEFDLISRHFSGLGVARDDVALGVGDDAALLSADTAVRMVVAWANTSMVLDGDHRAAGEQCAESACHQLVREGATPAWLTLALSVSDANDEWAAAFSAGINEACARHGVSLVGGDTTFGPDVATVFATGLLTTA